MILYHFSRQRRGGNANKANSISLFYSVRSEVETFVVVLPEPFSLVTFCDRLYITSPPSWPLFGPETGALQGLGVKQGSILSSYPPYALRGGGGI